MQQTIKWDVAAADDASSALSLFRFSLALMVLVEHLSAQVPHQTGRVAVEAFFCISGFLITMVASGRYAGRPGAFLINRFLRIYPTYWACLTIGIVVILLTPDSIALHPSLKIPGTVGDWTANVGVFGLSQTTVSRILPAAWSLHTELWFYFVIGLVTSVRPRANIAMLAITLVFSAYCAFWWGPVEFYGTPLGNADAFFIGSVVHQHRRRLAPKRPLLVIGTTLAIFELLAWGPYFATQSVTEFIAAPVAGLLLLGLWTANLRGTLTRWSSTTGLLGRLSYPLFLLHWPIGAVTMRLFGWQPGWPMTIVTGGLTLAVATLVLWFIEEPLLRIRARIRRDGPAPLIESLTAVSD
jgi:peptidoglycan/LPS O-acetylase OafA/YrhL